LLGTGTCSAAFTKENDPYPLFFLQRNLTNILVNDIIVPPVAARDYVYAHLAANYVLTANRQGKKLYGAIKGFPQINIMSASQYSPSIAASYAFYEVARKLVYTEKPLIDSFAALVKWYKKNGTDVQLLESSKKIGQQVAAKIIAWMNTDGFIESRTMNKYVLLSQPGKWQPTAPGYFPAIEPHWGVIRPMLITDFENSVAFLPKAFDTDLKSGYYTEAKELYETSLHLTPEEKKIAAFWDCNPFALKPAGHARSFVKKISPGGHWMGIAVIACKRKQTGLQQASDVLTLVSVTLFDAFIQTWKMKFIFNTVRPETYIQQTGMDPVWQPFIQAPPFPEFPSGHAVISTASAKILNHFFGNDFSYTDDTESIFGLGTRNFNSFNHAAKEASISRVYGGIHYPSSCSKGEEIGESIANGILKLYAGAVK
ncbi:MAG: vanadium-dependent haloperoxidase, partial [Sediminibacterium sp.]